MPDRRGSALPGAPPLPPGNPPSDLNIDYSSVEEIYCATKNIPLPDTMSDKDSDSDSSSDDRTSSSESEYDDSTSKKAQKSKGLKRKKPESSDESESEEEVESASGRRMYGARSAASIIEKKLASHHKKFVARHFSKFKKKEEALKALKENDVPRYNSHF